MYIYIYTLPISSQLAARPGAGVPTLGVRKFGAKYPHYPSFIVAQEWRDWANRITQNSQNIEV